MDYTARRFKLFRFFNQHISLAFYVCLPLSNNCLHNHLLTFTQPHFCLPYPPPNSMQPPPVPCFSPSALLSDMPTGTLTLSPVPLPSTGEWSLITVHELYDEMPLAHLTASWQLPLTTHCLFALQTLFASLFNAHNMYIKSFCDVDSHLESLFCFGSAGCTKVSI